MVVASSMGASARGRGGGVRGVVEVMVTRVTDETPMTLVLACCGKEVRVVMHALDPDADEYVLECECGATTSWLDWRRGRWS